VANLWGSSGNDQALLTRIETSFGGSPLVMGADDSPNKIVIAARNREMAFSPARIEQHINALSQSHPLNFQAKSRKLIAALAAQSMNQAS